MNTGSSIALENILNAVNFNALNPNTAIRLVCTDRSDIHLHFAIGDNGGLHSSLSFFIKTDKNGLWVVTLLFNETSKKSLSCRDNIQDHPRGCMCSIAREPKSPVKNEYFSWLLPYSLILYACPR